MAYCKEYKPPFERFIKKAHKPLQLRIEDAVLAIEKNPRIGEPKTGDLAGIRVYKFNFNNQEYLIAYKALEMQEKNSKIVFYLVGSHENFYKNLKRQY